MSETAASPTDSLTVLVATDADHVHDEVDAALEGDHTAVRVHTGAEVLAAVAAVFGEHGVSIRSMEQEGLGDEARLVFITHGARERDLRATLTDLRSLDAVRAVGSVLRVIGG